MADFISIGNLFQIFIPLTKNEFIPLSSLSKGGLNQEAVVLLHKMWVKVGSWFIMVDNMCIYQMKPLLKLKIQHGRRNPKWPPPPSWIFFHITKIISYTSLPMCFDPLNTMEVFIFKFEYKLTLESRVNGFILGQNWHFWT